MAFIKRDKKKSGTYLTVVHGYRDTDGIIKHKTLFNLGKAEDYSKQSLQLNYSLRRERRTKKEQLRVTHLEQVNFP